MREAAPVCGVTFQRLAEKTLLDAADVADFEMECFVGESLSTTINSLEGRIIKDKHAVL